MARIRTVKPDLFKHESLYDAERETGLPLRLAFIGLFTVCDREGRFAWRPRAIGTDVLPYDVIDFSRVLDALASRGFVVRYRVGNDEFGSIPSWHRHQCINNRELKSVIPEPPEVTDEIDASNTREDHDVDASLLRPRGREGKGREEEGKERTETNVSGAEAPVSNVHPIDDQAALFHEGLPLLASLSGKPVGSLRSVVGKWRQTTGNADGAILQSIRRASDQRVMDPVAWITKSLKPRDPDEAIYRGVL